MCEIRPECHYEARFEAQNSIVYTISASTCGIYWIILEWQTLSAICLLLKQPGLGVLCLHASACALIR